MNRAQVFCRDQHDSTSCNFTHATDDWHTAHLILNKLPGERGNSLLKQGIDKILFQVTKLQGTNQCLSGLKILHLF